MALKIILKPPFYPFRKGSFLSLDKTKGAILKEHTQVRWSGAHELRSYISIPDASDNDYAHSRLRTTNLLDAFKAPGKGPLKISIVYDPLVLVYIGSVEDECGWSHIHFWWYLYPYTKVWFPTKETRCWEAIKYFGTHDTDDISWNHIHSPKKFVTEFNYQPPNEISKGDLVLLEVGLELIHSASVDDVAISSLVDVTALVGKVEISAMGT